MDKENEYLLNDSDYKDATCVLLDKNKDLQKKNDQLKSKLKDLICEIRGILLMIDGELLPSEITILANNFIQNYLAYYKEELNYIIYDIEKTGLIKEEEIKKYKEYGAYIRVDKDTLSIVKNYALKADMYDEELEENIRLSNNWEYLKRELGRCMFDDLTIEIKDLKNIIEKIENGDYNGDNRKD